jgi:hypothetical protein
VGDKLKKFFARFAREIILSPHFLNRGAALVLVSGKVDEKVADRYPELVSEGPSFQTQLDMFHMVLGGMNTTESIKTAVTLDKCATVLRDMAPTMRGMFPLVDTYSTVAGQSSFVSNC